MIVKGSKGNELLEIIRVNEEEKLAFYKDIKDKETIALIDEKLLEYWKRGDRQMEYDRKLSASCVVIRDDKVLLVKHTYGAAKGKYLIPGGFSENGELPQKTAEREVLEETGVSVKANELLAVRFTEQEVWCALSIYL